MTAEVRLTLTRPTSGMLAVVGRALTAEAADDVRDVLATWGKAISCLSFSRPYPAGGEYATLELELGEDVDDQLEGEIERWLWVSMRGEMESGYLYRRQGPPNRYFRLRYPLDDDTEYGDATTPGDEALTLTPGPHDQFPLGQARTHLRLEQQDGYQRRLRRWLTSDGTEPPPEMTPPAEDELARMCAFYGCSCGICERVRDEQTVARYEDVAFGQLVAQTPSWLC